MHLFLFDCDGTLLDSQNSIVQSMERTFVRHDLEKPARSSILSIIGLSLQQAIAELHPNGDAKLITSMVEEYKRAYTDLRSSQVYEEPLYEGIADMLVELSKTQDLVLGVATGKSRRGLLRVLSQYNLEEYFTTLQTADDAPSKPHPGMIEQALAETGVEINKTVMIGDTTYDMQMARNAGALAVGVAWGYHGRSELYDVGAAEVMDSVSDLNEYLSLIVKSG